MGDSTLEKAKDQKKQLLKEKDSLREEIRSLDAQLDAVEKFIATWDAVDSGDWTLFQQIVSDGGRNQYENKNDTEASDSRTNPKRKNSDKEDVANGARELISRRGRPMMRKELFDGLIAQGFDIHGKDPEMVLSTMLWRQKDKVVRLKQGGYWLTDEPYPDGNYYPDKEYLIGATAEEAEEGAE